MKRDRTVIGHFGFLYSPKKTQITHFGCHRDFANLVVTQGLSRPHSSWQFVSSVHLWSAVWYSEMKGTNVSACLVYWEHNPSSFTSFRTIDRRHEGKHNCTQHHGACERDASRHNPSTCPDHGRKPNLEPLSDS